MDKIDKKWTQKDNMPLKNKLKTKIIHILNGIQKEANLKTTDNLLRASFMKFGQQRSLSLFLHADMSPAGIYPAACRLLFGTPLYRKSQCSA